MLYKVTFLLFLYSVLSDRVEFKLENRMLFYRPENAVQYSKFTNIHTVSGSKKQFDEFSNSMVDVVINTPYLRFDDIISKDVPYHPRPHKLLWPDFLTTPIDKQDSYIIYDNIIVSTEVRKMAQERIVPEANLVSCFFDTVLLFADMQAIDFKFLLDKIPYLFDSHPDSAFCFLPALLNAFEPMFHGYIPSNGEYAETTFGFFDWWSVHRRSVYKLNTFLGTLCGFTTDKDGHYFTHARCVDPILLFLHMWLEEKEDFYIPSFLEIASLVTLHSAFSRNKAQQWRRYLMYRGMSATVSFYYPIAYTNPISLHIFKEFYTKEMLQKTITHDSLPMNIEGTKKEKEEVSNLKSLEFEAFQVNTLGGKLPQPKAKRAKWYLQDQLKDKEVVGKVGYNRKWEKNKSLLRFGLQSRAKKLSQNFYVYCTDVAKLLKKKALRQEESHKEDNPYLRFPSFSWRFSAEESLNKLDEVQRLEKYYIDVKTVGEELKQLSKKCPSFKRGNPLKTWNNFLSFFGAETPRKDSHRHYNAVRYAFSLTKGASYPSQPPRSIKATPFQIWEAFRTRYPSLLENISSKCNLKPLDLGKKIADGVISYHRFLRLYYRRDLSHFLKLVEQERRRSLFRATFPSIFLPDRLRLNLHRFLIKTKYNMVFSERESNNLQFQRQYGDVGISLLLLTGDVNKALDQLGFAKSVITHHYSGMFGKYKFRLTPFNSSRKLAQWNAKDNIKTQKVSVIQSDEKVIYTVKQGINKLLRYYDSFRHLTKIINNFDERVKENFPTPAEVPELYSQAFKDLKARFITLQTLGRFPTLPINKIVALWNFYRIEPTICSKSIEHLSLGKQQSVLEYRSKFTYLFDSTEAFLYPYFHIGSQIPPFSSMQYLSSGKYDKDPSSVNTALNKWCDGVTTAQYEMQQLESLFTPEVRARIPNYHFPRELRHIWNNRSFLYRVRAWILQLRMFVDRTDIFADI